MEFELIDLKKFLKNAFALFPISASMYMFAKKPYAFYPILLVITMLITVFYLSVMDYLKRVSLAKLKKIDFFSAEKAALSNKPTIIAGLAIFLIYVVNMIMIYLNFSNEPIGFIITLYGIGGMFYAILSVIWESKGVKKTIKFILRRKK